MPNPVQPPDPATPSAAGGCGTRFELALVAAFKAGGASPALPRIARSPGHDGRFQSNLPRT
ncbi:hypothetical protein QLH51_18015 [Sphingomonas sp. 2R-10]|uniref:hypothetical protein n=1 Tax=Sphingomonas sp. 2R-10 TaxID=3045148 RepID=UPI000F7ABEF3|nr:hypothetical protein [Sphingomonas sp. 2R-10]MDJ0278693.1 hypothetical protein [Sphingomonas sp. 2R-10]